MEAGQCWDEETGGAACAEASISVGVIGVMAAATVAGSAPEVSGREMPGPSLRNTWLLPNV